MKICQTSSAVGAEMTGAQLKELDDAGPEELLQRWQLLPQYAKPPEFCARRHGQPGTVEGVPLSAVA